MSRQGLRLMGNWILVRMDPEDEKTASGNLIKPQGAHESIIRTGEVLQVGPGKWAPKGKVRTPVGVEVGEGVAFVKFAATNTKTAESLQVHLNKDEALMQPNDILLVYDRKEDPPTFG